MSTKIQLAIDQLEIEALKTLANANQRKHKLHSGDAGNLILRASA